MQVGKYLRKATDRFFHWCPGCDGPHPLFWDRGWTWNGDTDKPSFQPSFAHDRGNPNRRCHYVLTDGILHFQQDCHHNLKGQAVPLLPWPDEHKDWGIHDQTDLTA